MVLYLFLLAGLAGVGYAIWSYRRKSAAREADSRTRFGRMLGALRTPATPSPQPPSASSPGTAPAPAAPATAQAAAVAAAAPARFLGPPATLVYYLLKAGLPEWEVFANVSLAAVIAVPGAGHEREQQLRRLSQYQLDFVVCDKSMKIVAAVELEAAGGADTAGAQRFKADFLRQAGIRVVRINPAAPPRREQMRGLLESRVNG